MFPPGPDRTVSKKDTFKSVFIGGCAANAYSIKIAEIIKFSQVVSTSKTEMPFLSKSLLRFSFKRNF